jgi:hypothetical protein
MNLEKLIAQATCKHCRENTPKSADGKAHIVWCGGDACTPEKYPQGHYRFCTSQAGNKDSIMALRTYIKERIRKAKRIPDYKKSINYHGKLTIPVR